MRTQPALSGTNKKQAVNLRVVHIAVDCVVYGIFGGLKGIIHYVIISFMHVALLISICYPHKTCFQFGLLLQCDPIQDLRQFHDI